MKLLQVSETDLVLDVGANTGQFASELRSIGYGGRIVSFEPVASVFEELCRNASGDSHWDTINCALGDSNCNMEINLAGNSYSSSILDMLPSHVESAPESAYKGKEQIDVKTLDTLFGDIGAEGRKIWLKIDTQGFEKRVLDGAARSLEFINALQLEMSLVPLYDGELLYTGMIELLDSKGYELVAIEPGFSDAASGRLLQFDGIFFRR